MILRSLLLAEDDFLLLVSLFNDRDEPPGGRGLGSPRGLPHFSTSSSVETFDSEASTFEVSVFDSVDREWVLLPEYYESECSALTAAEAMLLAIDFELSISFEPDQE